MAVDFTPLARLIFRPLASKMKKVRTPSDFEVVQHRVLARLLHRARNTDVGRRYGFSRIRTYADFAAAVPVVGYEDIRADVMRMVRGEPGVLWPGRCRSFAQSSGTSGGKSKFIPVTADALRHNHYAGAACSVAAYLDRTPRSRLFGGKCLILGGSFANELTGVPDGVCVGDLSATLIDRVNPLVELFRVPGKDIALMPDWTRKLDAIATEAARHDITNISGVPSWFMGVLRRIMQLRGVDSIHDVWPNLEVFFHGGIAFEPYRRQYEAITDTSKMRYSENYNASEGFFATQDSDTEPGMLLLPDVGVFYELIPLESLDSGSPVVIPAWEAERGRTYALVISACNGLWRYLIGDTVRIESTAPLRISIAGRTSSFINAFGEEVMEWNTDHAIAETCRATGAAVANYTVAPVYAEGRQRGHHQWLIEWSAEPQCGVDAFADMLDERLQAVNSDYQAKRAGGIFLDRLEIVTLAPGAFDSWLRTSGKLGGQRKIPRLANDRHIADKVLEINRNLELDTLKNTEENA